MQLTRHLDANARLVSLIEPLALRDGYSQTGLPGVQVLRASCDVARGPHIYEPSLMIIAQGSKLAFLGPRTMEYGAGHYLIQALPVPFECETFALPDAPLLGVFGISLIAVFTGMAAYVLTRPSDLAPTQDR